MHRPFCVTYNFFHRFVQSDEIFVRKNDFLFYFASIGWRVVPDYMRTPVHTCRTVQRYASHWRSAYLHTTLLGWQLTWREWRSLKVVATLMLKSFHLKLYFWLVPIPHRFLHTSLKYRWILKTTFRTGDTVTGRKFCFVVDHLFLLPPCDQSLSTIENSAIKGTFLHQNLRIDY